MILRINRKIEMKFIRIQERFRAKSQMQDVLICENGVAVYRQCGSLPENVLFAER